MRLYLTCRRTLVPGLRRAGELSAAELESLMVIVANPRTFKIPDWFLNRQKDHKDGRYSQLTSSSLDTKLRDDLERLKKIRCARVMCYCCYIWGTVSEGVKSMT